MCQHLCCAIISVRAEFEMLETCLPLFSGLDEACHAMNSRQAFLQVHVQKLRLSIWATPFSWLSSPQTLRQARAQFEGALDSF